MKRALEMGKTSAAGSFQLLIGVASSTIIMAVGTIMRARYLWFPILLLLRAPHGTLACALFISSNSIVYQFLKVTPT